MNNDELLTHLDDDLKQAASAMTRNEARYVINAYLTMQDARKRSDQQSWAMDNRQSGEPHKILEALSDVTHGVELRIKGVLQAYAETEPMGRWALGVHGIGAIIAAGLLAHIDLEPWKCAHQEKGCCPEKPCSKQCKRYRIETVGHIWAFAGLDPTKQWKKGQKRPHNAQLKQICYYAGESFIKNSNNPESLYGRLYREYKAEITAKNESGGYADQAKALVETTVARYKTTAGYKVNKKGMLGKGHINNRARRFAVKQFLSDWFVEAYKLRWKKEPPAPYACAILQHAHQRRAA